MNEELKNAIKLLTGSKDDAEVQAALKELVPGMTVDDAIKMVEADDEGKKFLNTFADKRVTAGVTTAIDNFKKKDMLAIIDEKVKEKEAELTKKLKPELTETEKQLMETNKRIADLERKEKIANSTTAVTKLFAKEKMDTEFIDHFVGEDMDSSISSASTFIEKFKQAVKAEAEGEVQKIFDKHGYDPKNPGSNRNDGGDTGNVTKAMIEVAHKKAQNLGTHEARAEYSLMKRKYEAQKKKS